MLWLVWWARLQKEQLDGCWFPITLSVTDGLGDNAAGALNALILVPVSGGGRCPCARAFRFVRAYFRIRRSPVVEPQLIRTTLFPCSRLRTSITVRATGGRLVGGPRFTNGCSRHVHQLGYNLLIPLTVAPESLFERLRSGRGSSYWSSFRGGARVTPRG